MTKFPKVLAMAVVVAFHTIGCFAAAEPTPMPTATPDVGAMVRAAIAAALDGTAPPVPTPAATPASLPTYTPMPTPTLVSTNTPTPTPTPVPKRLEEAECAPDCVEHYKHPWAHVDWLSGPRVADNGMISLVVRVDDRINLVIPGWDGRDNITLTDHNHELLGSIVPPSGPGWDWTPQPGLWIASEYQYSDYTLTVRAQIDPAAATHPGLELCLWSGGSRSEQQLPDCVPVHQP